MNRPCSLPRGFDRAYDCVVGTEDSGKKVFLVNPPSVVGEQLLSALLKAEYEVYVVKEPHRAISVLRRFADSIVFVSIDSVLDEQGWKSFVKDLLSADKGGGHRVGILSYNPEPSLVQTYLMEIGVQCGFVQLKVGVQESTQIMLKALEANEARGRRKYVRARCADDRRVSFNVDVQGRRADGTILDISSVGMAVSFSQSVRLQAKSVLSGIQLRLRATLVRVDGVVLGTRADGTGVFVILFQHGRDGKSKRRIREYIHMALQDSIADIDAR